MPGSVQISSPTTVLPRSLSSSWTEEREFPLRQSEEYKDGRTQRYPIATISRRSWALGKMLSFTQWGDLQAFFLARKGSTQPFWWYPLDSDFDASGTSNTGRLAVRFDGGLTRQYALGRQAIGLRLIEVS